MKYLHLVSKIAGISNKWARESGVWRRTPTNLIFFLSQFILFQLPSDEKRLFPQAQE